MNSQVISDLAHGEITQSFNPKLVLLEVGCQNASHKAETRVEIAMKGHNLALTGQAGSGKSFLLREIVDNLQ